MKIFAFYVETSNGKKHFGSMEVEDEKEAREEIAIWAGDQFDVERLELADMSKTWFQMKEIRSRNGTQGD